METISNPKRGCGTMKPGAVYLRADLSTFGTLPAFVRIQPPIPHQEPHFRGIQYVNGLALDHVLGWSVIDLNRETPPRFRLDPDADGLNLTKRLSGEWFQRGQLHAEGGHPENFGAISPAWTFDILDWVGESYYPTPESFIEEAHAHGVNRRLPKGTFPKVVAGQTRSWFVHPRAITLYKADCPTCGTTHARWVPVGDGGFRCPGCNLEWSKGWSQAETASRPGVIGYSYLTRTIYTAPPGEAVPETMKAKAAAGLVDIVQLGPSEVEIPIEDGSEREDIFAPVNSE